MRTTVLLVTFLLIISTVPQPVMAEDEWSDGGECKEVGMGTITGNLGPRDRDTFCINLNKQNINEGDYLIFTFNTKKDNGFIRLNFPGGDIIATDSSGGELPNIKRSASAVYQKGYISAPSYNTEGSKRVGYAYESKHLGDGRILIDPWEARGEAIRLYVRRPDVEKIKMKLSTNENTANPWSVSLSKENVRPPLLASEATEKRYHELESKLEAKNQTISGLKNKLSIKNKKITNLTTKLDGKNTTISSLELELERKQSKINLLNTQLRNKNKTIQELEEQVGNLQERVQDLEEKTGSNINNCSNEKTRFTKRTNTNQGNSNGGQTSGFGFMIAIGALFIAVGNKMYNNY